MMGQIENNPSEKWLLVAWRMTGGVVGYYRSIDNQDCFSVGRFSDDHHCERLNRDWMLVGPSITANSNEDKRTIPLDNGER